MKNYSTQTLVLLILLVMFAVPALSQEKYLVYFSDKKGVDFDPIEYFDAKAIERRVKNGLPLDHISDYPVNPEYKESVATLIEESGFASRWFNFQVVKAFPYQIEMVEQLACVRKVEALKSRAIVAGYDKSNKTAMDKDKLIVAQTESMQGSLFEEADIRGKGVRVAVFDIGFNQVDKHGAFKHIRDDGRIIKTWDFIE
ncbi:MAG: hypothetical protein U9R19_01985, partial [Bacteroidota bacterium]|nr:hypothetical protein [Bacteroidota bacterium]